MATLSYQVQRCQQLLPADSLSIHLTDGTMCSLCIRLSGFFSKRAHDAVNSNAVPSPTAVQTLPQNPTS